MDKNTFNNLLDKYLDGTASEAEKKLLDTYYEQLTQLEPATLESDNEELLRREMLSGILTVIKKQPAVTKNAITKIMVFRRLCAAAAILIFIVAGIFFSRSVKQQHTIGIAKVPASQPAYKPAIHVTDKAILTLANGEAITLDSAGNGTLAQQGSTVVTKAGGHIFYGNKNTATTEITYNVLTTPKGGQYHVTLSDGTEVWLNASSSIRFPTAFNSSIRNVTITGEAYFEVAKNPLQPFQVNAKGMTVEVLGTHFNVMCYSDEATINTTLLEGAVKITGNKSGLLKPGQQSKFDTVSQSINIANADTEKAVAWKNGVLMFKKDDIKTIMRQVGRWYDVAISYNGEMPAKLYSGSISKYSDVSEVLKILALGGIKYRMEGNKIMVLH